MQKHLKFVTVNSFFSKIKNKLFYENLDEVHINGHAERRLPNNLNISFLYAEDNALLMNLKDIAISSGSACATAQPQPSHVLKALGINEERRHSAIRFGLGRFNTSEEIDYVADRVIETVKKLRKLSPLYKRKINSNSKILGTNTVITT